MINSTLIKYYYILRKLLQELSIYKDIRVYRFTDYIMIKISQELFSENVVFEDKKSAKQKEKELNNKIIEKVKNFILQENILFNRVEIVNKFKEIEKRRFVKIKKARGKDFYIIDVGFIVSILPNSDFVKFDFNKFNNKVENFLSKKPDIFYKEIFLNAITTDFNYTYTSNIDDFLNLSLINKYVNSLIIYEKGFYIAGIKFLNLLEKYKIVNSGIITSSVEFDFIIKTVIKLNDFINQLLNNELLNFKTKNIF